MEKRPSAEQLAKYKSNAKNESFSADVRAKFQSIVDKFENVGEAVVDAIEQKKERKPRTTKTTTKVVAKQTKSDIESAKAEIKKRTGKTEEECESIVEEYRTLRTKSQERKKKEVQSTADNKERVDKLKKDDKIISGTNEKTADAVIETTTKDVAEKIVKEIDKIEQKAEVEAKKEVEKEMPKESATEKKKAVVEKVEEKVKEKTKTIVKRIVIDTSSLLTSIAESLGKFDKDSQKEFLIKLRSDIDKLLTKYSLGGATMGATQGFNITQSNMSSSSVNPTMFGGGGGVGKEKIRKQFDGYYEDYRGEHVVSLVKEEDGSGYYFLDTTNGFSGGVSKSKASTKNALESYVAKNYNVVKQFVGGGGVGGKNVSGTAFYITTESAKESGKDFNTLADTYFESEDEFNNTDGIIQYTFVVNVENQYDIIPAIYEQMAQDQKSGTNYSDGVIQIIGFELDNYTRQYNSSPSPHNFESELPYDIEDEDEYKKGGGVDSNKIKEHVLECKKLVSAFCKEYGQRFSLNEKEILSKVSKSVTNNGANVFIGFDVNSNIESLKVDEVKPRTAYVILKSDINPNGVSKTIGIKRTYTIDFTIKGDKRYTKRRTEEGSYFKSYNYGLTIDEVMDKFDTDVIYELFPLEQKDNLKLTMSNVFAKGGLTEHGLRVGDIIQADGKTFGYKDEIEVIDSDKKRRFVNLDKGNRGIGFNKGGGVYDVEGVNSKVKRMMSNRNIELEDLLGETLDKYKYDINNSEDLDRVAKLMSQEDKDILVYSLLQDKSLMPKDRKNKVLSMMRSRRGM